MARSWPYGNAPAGGNQARIAGSATPAHFNAEAVSRGKVGTLVPTRELTIDPLPCGILLRGALHLGHDVRWHPLEND